MVFSKLRSSIFMKINDDYFSCEILSPCGSNPCIRGTCHNINSSSYQCLCEPGFTGKNCLFHFYYLFIIY
jgi:hypothetical protein